MTPFELPEKELQEEFFRPASGPGGQHLNKTSNGVRLIFSFEASNSLPDDVKERLKALAASKIIHDSLVLEVTESRSLLKNRETARIRMKQLIEKAFQKKKARKPTSPTRASRERRLQKKACRSRIKANRSNRNFPED